MKIAMETLDKLLRIFLFIFLFFIFLKPVIDPDFGWHLAQGAWMLEKRQIIRRDVLTWTYQGYPWEDFYWLTEVFFALIYKVGSCVSQGPALNKSLNLSFLSVFFSLYLVFFFWLALKGKKLGILGFLGTILAAGLLRGFVGVRPQVLSYGYFALLFWFLGKASQGTTPGVAACPPKPWRRREGLSRCEGIGERDFRKYLFFLPFLFLLWANTHGSFLGGLFFLFLFAPIVSLRGVRLNRRTKQSLRLPHFAPYRLVQGFARNDRKLRYLIFIIFLSFLATLVNPHGLNWSSLFGYLSNQINRDNILEFQSANFHQLFSWIFLLWVVVYYALSFPPSQARKEKRAWLETIFLTLPLTLKRAKGTPPRCYGVTPRMVKELASVLRRQQLFLTLPLTLMAFYAVRFIPIFVLVTLSEMVVNLNKWEKNYFGKFYKRQKVLCQLFKLYILIILVIFPLKIFTTEVWQLNTSSQLEKDGEYPLKAVSFLKKEKVEGRLFNQYEWGGFLAWQLPEMKTFIDGRMPSWKKEDKEIFADYLEITKLKPNWQKVLEDYQMDLFLIKKDSSLAQILEINSQWNVIYEDEMTGIYTALKKTPDF